MDTDIIVRIAGPDDACYANAITWETEAFAIKRGTGISKRSPEYVVAKMNQGNAVIAVTKAGRWVGFSYIQEWGNGEFVSNSGLIVDPGFRAHGVATKIKETIFQLARLKYPRAK